MQNGIFSSEIGSLPKNSSSYQSIEIVDISQINQRKSQNAKRFGSEFEIQCKTNFTWLLINLLLLFVETPHALVIKDNHKS